MLRKILTVFFISIIGIKGLGQDTLLSDILNKFKFKEHQIIKSNDTIFFHIYTKGTFKPDNLVHFLSGSTPDPIFTYEVKDGKPVSYFWGHQDFRLLPEAIPL